MHLSSEPIKYIKGTATILFWNLSFAKAKTYTWHVYRWLKFDITSPRYSVFASVECAKSLRKLLTCELMQVQGNKCHLFLIKMICSLASLQSVTPSISINIYVVQSVYLVPCWDNSQSLPDLIWPDLIQWNLIWKNTLLK
jgi:hypothetical protein